MSINRRNLLLTGTPAAVGGMAVAASARPARSAEPATVADPDVPAHGDFRFNEPYIDVDEWRDMPVRHRYVHGGFTGTGARFSFYYPPKEQYQGRFFQLVNPTPIHENSSEGAVGEEDYIGFAIDSGAYFVRTNQGGLEATASPGSVVDVTIGAYRVSAAGAEYSRVVAQKMYGGKRLYGYVFGGSGGAWRTMGCIENTEAWDGAVPFVLGCTHAIPAMFCARLHALRTVGDKMPAVVDALDPGGSGDIYAGLTEEEAAGLREATRMGFPPRTWFLWKELGWGPFSNLFDLVVANDPQYFKDFWTVPGYLGADKPESFKTARVKYKTAVKRVIMSNEAAGLGIPAPRRGSVDTADIVVQWQKLQDQWSSRPFPVVFEVEKPPPNRMQGGKMVFNSDSKSPGVVSIGDVMGDRVLILFTPVSGSFADVTSGVRVGDQIEFDNSDTLAVETYYRHAVPPSREFYVWDQFRKPDGTPIYPQRPRLIGPMFTQATAGSIPTGKFKGKMIVVESMMDEDAMPWQADWYRTKIRDHVGAGLDDRFRVYFTDNALHVSNVPQEYPQRTVAYRGALYQALRDLSAWIEQGKAPPTSSSYKIEEGQVILPATAAARKGIQPLVTLTANGGARADVHVGQAVELSGVIEAPPGVGPVVAAQWDFEGVGKYVDGDSFTAAPRIEVRKSYSFARPGTYFVSLRGVGQRQGNAKTPFGRIYNLARARVVVT